MKTDYIPFHFAVRAYVKYLPEYLSHHPWYFALVLNHIFLVLWAHPFYLQLIYLFSSAHRHYLTDKMVRCIVVYCLLTEFVRWLEISVRDGIRHHTLLVRCERLSAQEIFHYEDKRRSRLLNSHRARPFCLGYPFLPRMRVPHQKFGLYDIHWQESRPEDVPLLGAGSSCAAGTRDIFFYFIQWFV